MKQTFSLVALAGVVSVASGVESAVSREDLSSSSPNILVIMVDDLGYSDIGSYGSEIPTPSIDALAENGIRVLNFHNAARCCPSRASLVTGLYSHSVGVGYMSGRAKAPIPGEAGPMDRYVGEMIYPHTSLARIAKEAGYFTGISGKWHLNPADPMQQGFDRADTVTYSGTSYFWPFDRSGSKRAGETPSEEELAISDATYVTEWYADGVMRYLDETDETGQPFFIYWAPTAPHYPLHALVKDIEVMEGVYDAGPEAIARARYERMLELGIVEEKWPFELPDVILNPDTSWRTDVRTDADAWPPDPNYVFHNRKNKIMGSARSAESFEELMEIYAAQIVSLDRETGRVVDALKETGRLENTVILFFSDNGSSNEMQTTGDSWAQVSNLPFPKYKRYNTGGGNRTPLILHWPEGMDPRLKGSLSDSYGHVIDVMPTVMELTGQAYPIEDESGRPLPPLPGESLLPIFKGGKRELTEPLYFEHFGNPSVVTSRWKLVTESAYTYRLYNLNEDPEKELFNTDRTAEAEAQVSAMRAVLKKTGGRVLEQDGFRLEVDHAVPWRLYNLENDPLEQVDLASRHSETVRELATLWQEWADSVGARVAGNRRYGKDRLAAEDYLPIPVPAETGDR